MTPRMSKKQIDDENRTMELLNELAEIGSRSYVPEFVSQVSRFEKIGMAISHAGNFTREGYELANTIAEDWNAHGMVAVVDFLLGKPPYEYTLEKMARTISGEYAIVDSGRIVKITLLIEDVE